MIYDFLTLHGKIVQFDDDLEIVKGNLHHHCTTKSHKAGFHSMNSP